MICYYCVQQTGTAALGTVLCVNDLHRIQAE